MSKVIHFEIPVDHPDQMVEFYSTVFDWKIQKWGGPMDYWLAEAGDESESGIHGALTPRASKEQSIAIIIRVPDVEAALKKAVELGAEVAMPPMEVPDVGLNAYIKDPDGNLIGMMQEFEHPAA
ncbi:MAG: VOC family protein [Anaerolineaceae bacterium]|nr:VOC family protein [Anaerolineaceae bacterium]